MPRVQHVVLFRFSRELTPAEERTARDVVAGWVGEIPGLTRLRLGRDVGGRSEGFDHLLLTEFEDRASLEAYLAHPRHQEFARWVAEVGAEILRNDYALDASTSLLET